MVRWPGFDTVTPCFSHRLVGTVSKLPDVELEFATEQRSTTMARTRRKRAWDNVAYDVEAATAKVLESRQSQIAILASLPFCEVPSREDRRERAQTRDKCGFRRNWSTDSGGKWSSFSS